MNLTERAALLEQTAAAMRACVDGVPSGFRLEFRYRDIETWRPTGPTPEWNATDYRLTPIPQPRRVHLEAADVIVGKTLISREQWPIYDGHRECHLILHRSINRITVLSFGLTFKEMHEEGATNDPITSNRWLYSNDHELTWRLCSKEEAK